ncbi:LacI family DNA-binding transcriptional regulator [Winogradskya humida]|uniref:LacI family transcriptional regulator n=1 Tax=Winogradskya humida TaxID=113566 RepID=A0ABQ3ZH17_9ACTN|nr:LacI family DNA-binding transcriptional regulator [Actinoplanes humidus]GIE17870.1 LacI family transcriptional regulator [Actinoplanes humidus]
MAGNRAPTIYDVARRAGVAASTVSRAFSRPGRVAAGTADRIRAAATELGYRTNPVARATATGRTSMIALIVTDVTDPATAELLRGAQEAAGAAGFTTVVSDAQDDGVPQREALERALSTVDGAVVAAPHAPDTALRSLVAQRPAVLLDRMLDGLPSVVPDIADGMRRLMAHLGELGHEMVTYVAGPADAWADGMRRRGLRQAGCEYGVQSRRIGPFPATIAGGMTAAGELLRRPTTAVIAYDDLIAIGLIRALSARGILVPQEVSVVGFGNVAASALITPGLTTVASPLRAMGALGVRNLLGLLDGSGSAASEALPVRLVVRGSTAHRRRNPASAGRGSLIVSGAGSYLPVATL